MNPAKGTIFVIDGELTARKALERLLRDAGYSVETFASASEFLPRSRDRDLGCILASLDLPGQSGLDLQQALSAEDCALPIIFLSDQADIVGSVRAMRGGALNVLRTPCQDGELLPAIEEALSVCGRHLRELAASDELYSRFVSLTPREREVFTAVVAGKLNKQVAAELGAAEKTVKIHRRRVMEKMRAQSLADLVVLAERMGLHVGSSAPLNGITAPTGHSQEWRRAS